MSWGGADNNHIYALTRQIHEFDAKTINLEQAYKLCDKNEYGCQEAFSYLVQHIISLSQLKKTLISGSDNNCSNVYKLSVDEIPLMVLKCSKKPKYNNDIYREFMITKRFLNPLRCITPNFVYAYHLIPPTGANGHYKALYEFVKGKGIESYLTKLTPEDLCGILLQIAFSLHIAQNSCFFTHYDLHSGNIMLVPEKLDFTYYINKKNYRVKCDYTVKIIDYGYSFACASGIGIQQPGMYGARDLSHAKIYDDIYSTGFDLVKFIGFICKHIDRANVKSRYTDFDWMWKKYVYENFTNLKIGREKLFGINYSNKCNYMRPIDFIFELLTQNKDKCKLLEISGEYNGNFTSPDVYLSYFFPVVLGKTYTYNVQNSRLTGIYHYIYTRMYQELNRLGANVQEPKAVKFDVSRCTQILNKLSQLTQEGTEDKKKYKYLIEDALACTLYLAEMNDKDWKMLQHYRVDYRPLALINTHDKFNKKLADEKYKKYNSNKFQHNSPITIKFRKNQAHSNSASLSS